MDVLAITKAKIITYHIMIPANINDSYTTLSLPVLKTHIHRCTQKVNKSLWEV